MLSKKLIIKTKTYKIKFDISKEDAVNISSIIVLGDFNEWSYDNAFALKRDKSGAFSGTFEVPAGRSYHFRYLVNGADWYNDNSADRFEQSPLHPHIENSVVDCREKGKTKTAAKKAPAKSEKKAKTAKPAKTTAKSKADNLTKIEGIGPKIAGLLKEAGIDSYSKLAKAKVEKLNAILEAAGPRYNAHKPDTWPNQAALAAAGKWDELKQWQDELMGGK